MPNPAPSSRLVALKVAADRFDCSERTIRRMISAGELRGFRVGKRLLRVDADELDALARVIPTAGGVAC